MPTWGQARIDVRNNQKKIIGALKEGQSVKAIYEDLQRVDKISVSYNNFRKHVLPIKREIEILLARQRHELILEATSRSIKTSSPAENTKIKREEELPTHDQKFSLSNDNDLF